MKLKEPLSFAGRLYEAGESVKGKLPLDMIEALRRNKKLEEDHDDSESESNEQNQGAPDGNEGLPIIGGTIISVSDFAEKTAPEQKDYLKALGIDPAGKVEDRVAQYEEWYLEQVGNAGPKEQ